MTTTNVDPAVSARKPRQSKSKSSIKCGPGRPKAVLKLILNKTFAMGDVVALNPGRNKLTVRKHILDGVKSGSFTKLSKTVKSGKKGKPAHLFINTKVLTANLANLAKTKATRLAAAAVIVPSVV